MCKQTFMLFFFIKKPHLREILDVYRYVCVKMDSAPKFTSMYKMLRFTHLQTQKSNADVNEPSFERFNL